MDQRSRSVFHDFLWVFIISVCGRYRHSKELFCFFYIFFCHSLSIFLPSPPTPSLFPPLTALKAPPSAGLWIYRLHGHDQGRSERSTVRNRISLHQNRSKGCCSPARASVFGLVQFSFGPVCERQLLQEGKEWEERLRITDRRRNCEDSHQSLLVYGDKEPSC